MRPEILFPLFAPLTSLKGVGPRLAKLLEKIAGPRIVDLLWVLPSGLLDWRHEAKIAQAAEGERAMFKLMIGDHAPARGPGRPARVKASDATSFVDLVFFHAHGDYLARTLPPGSVRYIGGRIEHFQDRPQIVHPERILTEEEFADAPKVEAVYPLTEGLQPRVATRAISGAVARCPVLPEWQDPAWLARNNWPGFREALTRAHAPEAPGDLDPQSVWRLRLAYDEMLANQLALTLMRARMKKVKGRVFPAAKALRAALMKALPFALTEAQAEAIAAIDTDLVSGERCLRLLQGDVGSGKTIVALMAMLNAVASGAQAALMAPTEVLARQHAATLTPLCAAIGVEAALLTGRERGQPREALLQRLKNGQIAILIGTHALISEDVGFRDLGLIIFDEQHRFGVQQRLALSAKGSPAPHVLATTATPIPRTLALTYYGDMDVTRLWGKPPGRQPIATRVLPLERIEEVIEGLHRMVARGERAFWVCPLVEESEVLDVKAAEARHQELVAVFGASVGLLHGRMRASEKDAVIGAFRDGRIPILVSTTVVEVGVDVPEATVMIVEHAERFGLSQLHQLRGRVGRGKKPSSCLLLYQAPLGEVARARLHCLRDTEDGFKIAEEDLRLRGPGEVLGDKQSGQAMFRLASLEAHGALLEAAHDDARLILARDPALASPRAEALRLLLYLFERDEAVRALRAG